MAPHETAQARPDGMDGWVVMVPGPPVWFGRGPFRRLYIGRRGVGLDDAPRIPLAEIERVYWSRFLRLGRLVVVTSQGDLTLEFPLSMFRRGERALSEARLDAIVTLIRDATEHEGDRGTAADVPDALTEIRS